jgi:hypothetical protein
VEKAGYETTNDQAFMAPAPAGGLAALSHTILERPRCQSQQQFVHQEQEALISILAIPTILAILGSSKRSPIAFYAVNTRASLTHQWGDDVFCAS